MRKVPNVDNQTPGQIAYQAYGQVTDFKNYQGLPMPLWSDTIKSAWEAAARSQLTSTEWQNRFDERQRNQIEFSRLYAELYHHGADGHNNMMIIAKMADLLDGKA